MEREINNYIFEGRIVNTYSTLEYFYSITLSPSKKYRIDIYKDIKQNNKLYYICDGVLLFVRTIDFHEFLELEEYKDKEVMKNDFLFNNNFLSTDYVVGFVNSQREEAMSFEKLVDVGEMDYEIKQYDSSLSDQQYMLPLKQIKVYIKKRDNIYFFVCRKNDTQKILCKGEIPELFLKTKNFSYKYYFEVFICRILGCELEELPQYGLNFLEYYTSIIERSRIERYKSKK